MLDTLLKLDICLLINNSETFEIGKHKNISHLNMKNYINTNCIALTILSVRILSKMSLRNKKSGVINISSLIDKGNSGVCLYSASKDFVNKLT